MSREGMTVQEVIDMLSRVEDKTRLVVCFESDFAAKDSRNVGQVREVNISGTSNPVRIYTFR